MQESALFVGAPVRIRQWLVPPVAVLGLAAIEFSTGTIAQAWGLSALSIAVVAILALAAAACVIFGYLAYRDLSPHAVHRYAMTSVLSLFAIGVLLSAGVLGWVVLLWAGRQLGNSTLAGVGPMQSRMPDHLRTRTTVVAAVVGVTCLFLLPLVVGLGSLPLVTLVMVGRIVAPFVFGFAFRSQPRTSDADGSVAP